MVKAPGKEIPLRFSNCGRPQETDHVIHSVDLRQCDPGSTFNTIKGIEDGGLLHNGVRITENYHCGILDKEAEYICLGVFFVCFVVIHGNICGRAIFGERCGIELLHQEDHTTIGTREPRIMDVAAAADGESDTKESTES